MLMKQGDPSPLIQEISAEDTSSLSMLSAGLLSLAFLASYVCQIAFINDVCIVKKERNAVGSIVKLLVGFY